MGQRAITIYTADGADAHISADDDAFIYSALAGVKSGVLGNLTCVKIDDNTVRLSGGGVMNRGHMLRIPDGETLDLTVSSGTAGYQRYDSVVAEFIKGGGETPDVYRIRLMTGTPVTAGAQPPSVIHSSLLNQNDVNQLELFRLYLEGTTLTGITPILPRLTGWTAWPHITYGTAAPSGGSDGDIYLRLAE